MQSKTEQKATARSLYTEGLTYNQISSKLTVSKSSVSLWCRDLAERRRAERGVLSIEDVAQKKREARKLARTGKCKTEIATELKVSVAFVYVWCKDIFTKNREALLALKPERSRLSGKRTRKIVKGIPCEKPYEGYLLYCYTEKDSVTRVRLYKSGKKSDSRVLSLARYRMSVKEGRILEKHEVVAHIKGKSDDLSNLRLVTKQQLELESLDKRKTPCCVCGGIFLPKTIRRKTCSSICSLALRRNAHSAPALQNTRLKCDNCGTWFDSKSPKALTCSPKCRNEKRSKMRASKLGTSNYEYVPKGTKTKPKVKVPKAKPQIPPKKHKLECVICESKFLSVNKSVEFCSVKCLVVAQSYEREGR